MIRLLAAILLAGTLLAQQQLPKHPPKRRIRWAGARRKAPSSSFWKPATRAIIRRRFTISICEACRRRSGPRTVRNSRANWKTCSTTPRSTSRRSAAIRREISLTAFRQPSIGWTPFHVDGQTLELQLERVELKPGFHVWLVSADSVAMIPKAHQVVAETPFEKKLPQPLVTFEILDTPVWRWIALAAMAVALWICAGWLSWALVAVVRRAGGRARVSRSVARGSGGGGFSGGDGNRAAIHTASVVHRTRAGADFSLAVAWAGAVVVDLMAERWHGRLDPRVQAVSYSVLPLGRQILKLSAIPGRGFKRRSAHGATTLRRFWRDSAWADSPSHWRRRRPSRTCSAGSR